MKSLAPWFADCDLLLCPTCLRRIPFEEFSLEHIIPQQALGGDHKTAQEAVTRNQRSCLTLQCSKRLVIKDKLIAEKGCNGWKGKHFDRFIRQILQGRMDRMDVTTRHNVALLAFGYLALFRQYGYRISLSRSGVLMRHQFFNAGVFWKDLPEKCQMLLGGPPLSEFNDNIKSYWHDPFKITIHDAFALVSVRSVVFWLPLSEDPMAPLATLLRYGPPRLRFRPDFTSMF